MIVTYTKSPKKTTTKVPLIKQTTNKNTSAKDTKSNHNQQIKQDNTPKTKNTTKTIPKGKEQPKTKPTIPPPSKKIGGKTSSPLPPKSLKKAEVIKKPIKGKPKLAPQVGDIENRARKQLPEEREIKGERVDEVDVQGELVEDENVVGQVFKGNATTMRPNVDPSKDR